MPEYDIISAWDVLESPDPLETLTLREKKGISKAYCILHEQPEINIPPRAIQQEKGGSLLILFTNLDTFHKHLHPIDRNGKKVGCEQINEKCRIYRDADIWYTISDILVYKISRRYTCLITKVLRPRSFPEKENYKFPMETNHA